VGLPPAKNIRDVDIGFLNDVFRDRAEKDGIGYIDVWDAFVDEDGDFSMRGPDVNGQTRLLRTADGLNFTKQGARKPAVDVFVDELDLAELEFSGVDPEATGRPSYHPSVLLKLYIYGYLNRVQSSRRLEREAGRNVEGMWLTGRLAPDHKRSPISARTTAGPSGRCAPALSRSVAPWACSRKPSSRSMAASSRR
jgi:hypothetical protein